MVLLHRRELLIPTLRTILSSRWIATAFVALVMAACGGEEPAAENGDASGLDTTAAALGDTLAPKVVPDGSSMPSAERAGGIAPYPGAVVWNYTTRRVNEFESVEAFTGDAYADVVAWYDSTLVDWRREEFEDATTYTLDPDMAAVMVSPWDGASVQEGAPDVVRNARTAIGVAWKKELVR